MWTEEVLQRTGVVYPSTEHSTQLAGNNLLPREEAQSKNKLKEWGLLLTQPWGIRPRGARVGWRGAWLG